MLSKLFFVNLIFYLTLTQANSGKRDVGSSQGRKTRRKTTTDEAGPSTSHQESSPTYWNDVVDELLAPWDSNWADFTVTSNQNSSYPSDQYTLNQVQGSTYYPNTEQDVVKFMNEFPGDIHETLGKEVQVIEEQDPREHRFVYGFSKRKCYQCFKKQKEQPELNRFIIETVSTKCSRCRKYYCMNCFTEVHGPYGVIPAEVDGLNVIIPPSPTRTQFSANKATGEVYRGPEEHSIKRAKIRRSCFLCCIRKRGERARGNDIKLNSVYTKCEKCDRYICGGCLENVQGRICIPSNEPIQIDRCPLCHTYLANDLEAMVSHSKLCDKVDRAVDSEGCIDESYKYTCFVCPFHTDNRQSMKRHYQSHIGDFQFECPIEDCTYATNQKGNLKRHSAIHQ